VQAPQYNEKRSAPRSLGEVGTKMYYTYILQSKKDNTKYIGMTSNLKQRFGQHNYGASKYTNSKRPYRLIWYCAFSENKKAYDFERYLKSSSGYAFTKKHFL